MDFLSNVDWTTSIVTLVIAFLVIPIILHLLGR